MGRLFSKPFLEFRKTLISNSRNWIDSLQLERLMPPILGNARATFSATPCSSRSTCGQSCRAKTCESNEVREQASKSWRKNPCRQIEPARSPAFAPPPNIASGYASGAACRENIFSIAGHRQGDATRNHRGARAPTAKLSGDRRVAERRGEPVHAWPVGEEARRKSHACPECCKGRRSPRFSSIRPRPHRLPAWPSALPRNCRWFRTPPYRAGLAPENQSGGICVTWIPVFYAKIRRRIDRWMARSTVMKDLGG